jgi:ectoine hydroxylase-related dioxygenase (phytanoyl-CoA dioxygenase family)
MDQWFSEISSNSELPTDAASQLDDVWPMVGFIIMVDEFRSDNGSTRFVPGSHQWADTPRAPGDIVEEATPDQQRQLLASGPARSVIIYNGSVWHGHSANLTSVPQRSIQGAYIRRDAVSGIDLPARMRTETLRRISPLEKYVLAS